MFGLLLRADQETAKRAIISGGHDRGRLREKEGEIRERGTREIGVGMEVTSKVFAARWGWKDHTTSHHAPHTKLLSFPSLLQRCVFVQVYTHSCTDTYEKETRGCHWYSGL